MPRAWSMMRAMASFMGSTLCRDFSFCLDACHMASGLPGLLVPRALVPIVLLVCTGLAGSPQGPAPAAPQQMRGAYFCVLQQRGRGQQQVHAVIATFADDAVDAKNNTPDSGGPAQHHEGGATLPPALARSV